MCDDEVVDEYAHTLELLILTDIGLRQYVMKLLMITLLQNNLLLYIYDYMT